MKKIKGKNHRNIVYIRYSFFMNPKKSYKDGLFLYESPKTKLIEKENYEAMQRSVDDVQGRATA